MARIGGAERRTQFIQAAQELFYTKGYESTSINDIIEAVGVSKGAFYHHFESKQAVLIAVVDSLVAQSRKIIEPILNSTALNAIEKLNRIVRTSNSWKIGQRDQMLAVAKILYSDDNLHLRNRIDVETKQMKIAAFSQVLKQGVAEGVFDWDDLAEDHLAEFVLAIMQTAGETFIRLLLDPERPADAIDVVTNKFMAAQKIVERVLGAPAGSLSLIDRESIVLWFA